MTAARFMGNSVDGFKWLYRVYIEIMEKKVETTIMENQMEKNMKHEMETGIIRFKV